MRHPLPGSLGAKRPTHAQFSKASAEYERWTASDTTEGLAEAVRFMQANGGGLVWQPWHLAFAMPDALIKKFEDRMLAATLEESSEKVEAISQEFEAQASAYRKKQNEPDLSECPFGWLPVYVPASAEAMLMMARAESIAEKANKKWRRSSHRPTESPESAWEKQQREILERKKLPGVKGSFKASLQDRVNEAIRMGFVPESNG